MKNVRALKFQKLILTLLVISLISGKAQALDEPYCKELFSLQECFTDAAALSCNFTGGLSYVLVPFGLDENGVPAQEEQARLSYLCPASGGHPAFPLTFICDLYISTYPGGVCPGYNSVPIPKNSVPAPTPVAQAPVQNPINKCGSRIEVDNLVLGESVAIPGVDFSFNYSSDRVPSRVDNSILNIPLVGSSTTGISQVKLHIDIAGQIKDQTFTPSANLKTTYFWNGFKGDGTFSPTSQIANITITYVGAGGAQQSSTYQVPVGHFQSVFLGLGGWMFSNLHFYDYNARTIYYGYGGLKVVDGISHQGETLITSDDGREAYLFDQTGRHVETRDTYFNTRKYAFAYSAAGYLNTVTNQAGRQYALTRNGLDAVALTYYGQTISSIANSNGYITSITNPSGATYSFQYNGSGGLLTQFTRPDGKTSTMTYDSHGYLIKDLGPGGHFSSYSRQLFTDGSSLIQELTSMGIKSSYQISSTATSSTRRETRPTGEVENVVSNQIGNSSVADSNGVTTSSQTQNGLRFGAMAPLTSKSSASVGNSNLNLGVLTSEEFTPGSDPLLPGYVKQTYTQENDATKKTTYEFYGNTNQEIITSAEGRKVESDYNPLGLVQTQKVGSLTPINFAYDSDLRMISSTQGDRVTKYAYDSLGNLSQITEPNGKFTKYTYDQDNRVISIQREDYNKINFTYDVMGNLTSVTPPFKQSYQFLVNDFDFVSQMTAPSTYQGRFPSSTVPDDVIVNLLNVLPPKLVNLFTPKTTYQYNLDKGLTKVTYPDGRTISLNYDSTTNLLTSVDGNGLIRNYNYLPNSRLVSSIESNGITLNYSYVGDLVQSESITGSVSSHIDYNYNSDFTLGAININGQSIGYSYDKDNLVTGIGNESLTRDQNGLITSSQISNVKSQVSYNSFGEMLLDQYSNGPDHLFDLQLVRTSKLGQVTEKVESSYAKVTTKVKGKDVTSTVKDTAKNFYSYDSLGRLVQVSDGKKVIESYTYDSNGNKISARFNGEEYLGVYDAEDKLLQFGGIKYTYDKAGNLSSKTEKGKTTSYSFDVFGSLTQASLDNGTKIIDYINDPNGRRIGKKVNGVLVKGYVWSGNQLVGELDGSGTLTKTFIYGTKVNSPDYMIMNGKTYRIISDQVGSPREVVDALSGSVIAQMSHTAFGVETLNTSPDLLPFGFAGGLVDRDTGLVRFGVRQYSVFEGRWLQKDPSLHLSGELNLYAYGWNDPVNYVDFTGEQGVAAAELPVLEVIGETAEVAAAVEGAVLGVSFAAGWKIGEWIDKNFIAPLWNEHTKNKRPSTQEKHEKGQSRKQRDLGGEKADKQRRVKRIKPDGWKGSWPPSDDGC